MKKPQSHLIALSLFALSLSSNAAIPLSWKVETTRVAPVTFDCYHGEELLLQPSFYVNGTALQGSFNPVIYWQTNDMGTVYWKTNTVVYSGNTAAASFKGSYDPGAPLVRGFIALEATNSVVNYRANFTLRYRPSPGFDPNALPIPPQTIDFAKVTILNPTSAPFVSLPSPTVTDGYVATKTENGVEWLEPTGKGMETNSVNDLIHSYDVTNITPRIENALNTNKVNDLIGLYDTTNLTPRFADAVKYTSQTNTSERKTVARANIDAIALPDIVDRPKGNLYDTWIPTNRIEYLFFKAFVTRNVWPFGNLVEVWARKYDVSTAEFTEYMPLDLTDLYKTTNWHTINMPFSTDKVDMRLEWREQYPNPKAVYIRKPYPMVGNEIRIGFNECLESEGFVGTISKTVNEIVIDVMKEVEGMIVADLTHGKTASVTGSTDSASLDAPTQVKVSVDDSGDLGLSPLFTTTNTTLRSTIKLTTSSKVDKPATTVPAGYVATKTENGVEWLEPTGKGMETNSVNDLIHSYDVTNLTPRIENALSLEASARVSGDDLLSAALSSESNIRGDADIALGSVKRDKIDIGVYKNSYYPFTMTFTIEGEPVTVTLDFNREDDGVLIWGETGNIWLAWSSYMLKWTLFAGENELGYSSAASDALSFTIATEEYGDVSCTRSGTTSVVRDGDKTLYVVPSGGIPESDIAPSALWYKMASVDASSGTANVANRCVTELYNTPRNVTVRLQVRTGLTTTLALIVDCTDWVPNITFVDSGSGSSSHISWSYTSGDTMSVDKKYIIDIRLVPQGSTSTFYDGIMTVRELSESAKELYTKPSGGIPSSDMASAVQTSLGKADTAIQPVSSATSGNFASLNAQGNLQDSGKKASDFAPAVTGGYLPRSAGPSYPITGNLYLRDSFMMQWNDGTFEFSSGESGMFFFSPNGVAAIGSPLTPDGTDVMTLGQADFHIVTTSPVTSGQIGNFNITNLTAKTISCNVSTTSGMASDILIWTWGNTAECQMTFTLPSGFTLVGDAADTKASANKRCLFSLVKISNTEVIVSKKEFN